MKINKDRLHPLFDQYSNEENRLTHALLHTVGSSEWLFSRFLKSFVGIDFSVAKGAFEISTQKVPFSHGDEKAEEVESIPDAWVVDEASNLGIAVEVKDRRNSLSLSQLRRHANRIRTYKHPYLLVITPDLRKPTKIVELERKEGKRLNVVWRSWDEVFRWLTKLPIKRSEKRKKEEFLVASMREYLERRREVLGFQGIYFPKGFNVVEAKAILNAEMEELESTVKKIYRDLVKRRPAITTFSQEGVWDCFGSEDGFTTDLHITLGISERMHTISLIIPNSAKKAWARLKTIFYDEAYEDQLFSILHNVRKKVPYLFIEFTQRHFIAMKHAFRDGYMEFDIDTLGPPFRTKQSKAKEFPVWLHAVRAAIVYKRGTINTQVGFRSRFYLNQTKGIEKPQFIKTAKDTLKAFKPLYDFLGKSA